MGRGVATPCGQPPVLEAGQEGFAYGSGALGDAAAASAGSARPACRIRQRRRNTRSRAFSPESVGRQCRRRPGGRGVRRAGRSGPGRPAVPPRAFPVVAGAAVEQLRQSQRRPPRSVVPIQMVRGLVQGRLDLAVQGRRPEGLGLPHAVVLPPAGGGRRQKHDGGRRQGQGQPPRVPFGLRLGPDRFRAPPPPPAPPGPAGAVPATRSGRPPGPGPRPPRLGGRARRSTARQRRARSQGLVGLTGVEPRVGVGQGPFGGLAADLVDGARPVRWASRHDPRRGSRRERTRRPADR